MTYPTGRSRVRETILVHALTVVFVGGPPQIAHMQPIAAHGSLKSASLARGGHAEQLTELTYRTI